MSLMDSRGILSKATKDLFARWGDVQTVWSDAQSHEFEKKYLLPIEQDVRAALSALDQMNQVLDALVSDCE
jgi:hypothetical protein